MNRIILIIKFAIAAAWTAMCYCYGRDIPLAAQSGLFDALRNMSAIIFGIMGAWIAILHPDLLSHLTTPSKLLKQELPDSRHLIAPMIYAAIALIYTLFMEVLRPVASQFAFLLGHIATVRGVSYAALGLLAALQIWALVLSFAPYAKVKMAQELLKADASKARALIGDKRGIKDDDNE